MCWNVEVSVAAAAIGWAACIFLLWRGGRRDAWYARYLFTFTFTQLIDIVFWSMHARQPYSILQGLHIKGGITSCMELQASWSLPSKDNPQLPNFVLTKCVLPVIVWSQYAMQCTYPSKVLSKSGQRPLIIVAHALPSIIMSFFFACTTTADGLWPWPKETLQWGGDFGWSIAGVARGEAVGTYWLNQLFALLSGVHVALIFWLLCPQRVFVVHVLTLAAVMGFQWITEGTLHLGSKWCTYCLIYSAVYIADPLWMPEDSKHQVVPPVAPEAPSDCNANGGSGVLRKRHVSAAVGGQ